MLSTKEDIYFDYSQKNFEKELSKKANIINTYTLADSKRILYEYKTL